MSKQDKSETSNPAKRNWFEAGTGAAAADAAPGAGPTERDRSQDAPHFRVLDDEEREAEDDKST